METIRIRAVYIRIEMKWEIAVMAPMGLRLIEICPAGLVYMLELRAAYIFIMFVTLFTDLRFHLIEFFFEICHVYTKYKKTHT